MHAGSLESTQEAFLNLGIMLFMCTIQLIPSMRLRLSRFVVVVFRVHALSRSLDSFV